jgi:hypothetical protein
MTAQVLAADAPSGPDAVALLTEIATALRAGEVVPYIGPGVTELCTPEIPVTPTALADFFATKVALPKRAKGNAWASAQHIESMKHRSTVTALMTEAFRTPVTPGSLQSYLAGLKLPMIVDSWYDGAFRTALAGHDSWGEVQGITRAGIGEDRWYRFYDKAGKEASKGDAEGWATLLYKPHGSIVPAANFLISDADYVEVLTEIDIQTPIPETVKNRRAGRNFLFLGCRFNDQLLRTYARQVMKRSGTRHYAVVEAEMLSRNEICFLSTQGITIIDMPLARAADILLGEA